MIVSIPKTLVWMYQNSLCHPKETNVGWKFTCCWISLVERKWRPLKPFSLFGGSNNTWDGSCSLASWVALASLAACYVLETSCRIRDDALRIRRHGGWDGRQRLGSHDHGRAPLHVFQIHAQPDRGDSSHAGLGGSCLSSWPQWGAPRGWSGGDRRPEEGGGGGELPWWKPSSVLNAWVMEAAFIPRGPAGFGHGKNYNLTFSGAGTIIGGSSSGQWDKFNRPPDISSLCPLSPKTDEKCKVAILINCKSQTHFLILIKI